jgi:FG-GAP-like repeat
MTMLRRIELSLSCVLLFTSCLMAQYPIPNANLNQPSVPDHAAPGSPDTQIVVSGTSLVSGGIEGQVVWNGSYLTTNPVGNQLVATIPASFLAVAKTAQVTEESLGTARNGFSIGSNTLFFTVGPRTKYLSSTWNRRNYAIGGQTERQAVADFNGDGILDIVSLDTQNNAIRVLLGKANGTFQNPVSYATGNGPSGLVVSDLQDTFSQSIAVANYNDGTVSVFLNNGNGTFQNRVDYPVGRGPVALASADFENDGAYDLAVVNSLDNTVTILSNDTGGILTPLRTLATGPNPTAITFGDFDHDGVLDLAVTNFGNYTGNTLSIFYGGVTRVDLTTDAGPQSVIAVDVNRDGILDLVTANGCGHAATCGRPGTVSVFLGNANGTFQNAVNYDAGSYPFAVVAANFRNGSALDLAVTDLDSGNIDILYGNGHGTFVQGPLIPTNSRPTGLAVGDINNDGKLDLVVGGTSPAQVTIMTQP